MDMEKVYDNLPVVILLGVMFGTQLAPDPIKPWLFWGGMITSIIMMAGTEYIFQINASKYLYIRAIIRPTNRTLHLFIDEPEDSIGKHSRCIDIDEEGRKKFETPLNLGEQVIDPFYKKIKQLVIIHQMEWNTRMHFMPGRAVYKGYPVSHNKTATIILYIPQNMPAQIDHLTPIPIFELAEAPQDYHILGEPANFDNPSQILAILDANGKETEQSTNTKAQVTQLSSQLIEQKRRYFNEHQVRLQLEGEVEELRNEFNGVLGRGRNVAKMVWQLFLAAFSARADINDAAEDYKPNEWFKIGKWAALLGLGGLGIVMFAINADLRTWVGDNLIWIIAGAAVIVFVSGYGYKRSRRNVL